MRRQKSEYRKNEKVLKHNFHTKGLLVPRLQLGNEL